MLVCVDGGQCKDTILLLLSLLLFWWSPFILFRNLDEVFTYNHMTLISLRSRSHVKEYIVLMRADHLCIYNYIRSFLNIILRPILLVHAGLKHASYYLYIVLQLPVLLGFKVGFKVGFKGMK